MGTDLQRATSRPTLQFSYNLHNQPKDRCPFKFWNLVELDPSNFPGGNSHTSIWEWQPLSLPVVFRADVSEGAFLVLLSIHHPIDLSVSAAGGRMCAIRPANPVHWPSIQAFSEHWKLATPQGQGQRGHGGWVNGLWSFNQERRHEGRMMCGSQVGVGDLPLAPEHFTFFLSGNYSFSVDFISNLLKSCKQLININFLHTLCHLSKPLTFCWRYNIILSKAHALFST